MTSDEAVDRLKALIAQAGVDTASLRAGDVDRVWDVMRRFAAEAVDDIAPLEEESDGILAQYGTYDWGEGERFEIEFARQFAFNDGDGEYDHMSQLHCQFLFEPTDALRALGADDLLCVRSGARRVLRPGARDAGVQRRARPGRGTAAGSSSTTRTCEPVLTCVTGARWRP